MRLPSTVDDLWKDTDRKVRNQVRKAQKEGLVVQEGGEELVDDFYSVFSRNMRDLGTPVYPKRLFAETLAILVVERQRVRGPTGQATACRGHRDPISRLR